MTDTVLCINAGSSSLKFKVFEAATGGDLPVRLEGQLEGIGDKPHLAANDGAGRQLVDQGFTASEIPDVGAAVPRILDWLRGSPEGRPAGGRGASRAARRHPLRRARS
jgi:acetate kinase